MLRSVSQLTYQFQADWSSAENLICFECGAGVLANTKGLDLTAVLTEDVNWMPEACLGTKMEFWSSNLWRWNLKRENLVRRRSHFQIWMGKWQHKWATRLIHSEWSSISLHCIWVQSWLQDVLFTSIHVLLSYFRNCHAVLAVSLPPLLRIPVVPIPLVRIESFCGPRLQYCILQNWVDGHRWATLFEVLVLFALSKLFKEVCFGPHPSIYSVALDVFKDFPWRLSVLLIATFTASIRGVYREGQGDMSNGTEEWWGVNAKSRKEPST